MHILVKSGLGIGTIAGVSGLGYGIYNHMKTTPEVATKTVFYSEKLSGTLLSVAENQNSTEWGKRLETLKEAEENDLVDSLKSIKDKKTPQVASWQDLRNWCRDNIKKTFNGQEDKEFLNIQSYCTFSIKEKIENAVNESEGDSDDNKWAVGHGKLSAIDNSELVPDLVTAKGKQNEEGKRAVKEWCIKAYKKPYKGTEDKDYKNASKVCVSK